VRVTEFMRLDADAVGQAIHEVVETIREDSPGGDHLRAAASGSSTERLMVCLLHRVRDRSSEYGARIGVTHGLMMAFRIGAAYGRRVRPPAEEPT